MPDRLSRFARLALPALAMLTAGCGGRLSPAAAPARERETEYRGHYTRGAAGSWFTPCGAAVGDSAWWVTATGGSGAQLEAAKAAGRLVDGTPSYVHWRAVLTRTGEVGPRGRGAPALLVRDVLEVRARTSGDCSAG